MPLWGSIPKGRLVWSVGTGQRVGALSLHPTWQAYPHDSHTVPEIVRRHFQINDIHCIRWTEYLKCWQDYCIIIFFKLTQFTLPQLLIFKTVSLRLSKKVKTWQSSVSRQLQIVGTSLAVITVALNANILFVRDYLQRLSVRDVICKVEHIFPKTELREFGKKSWLTGLWLTVTEKTVSAVLGCSLG